MPKPTLNPDSLARHYNLTDPVVSEDLNTDYFSQDSIRLPNKNRQPAELHSSHESFKRKAAKYVIGAVATAAAVAVTTLVSENLLGNREHNPWQQPTVSTQIHP